MKTKFVQLVGGPHDGRVVEIPPADLYVEVPGLHGTQPDRYVVRPGSVADFVARP